MSKMWASMLNDAFPREWRSSSIGLLAAIPSFVLASPST